MTEYSIYMETAHCWAETTIQASDPVRALDMVQEQWLEDNSVYDWQDFDSIGSELMTIKVRTSDDNEDLLLEWEHDSIAKELAADDMLEALKSTIPLLEYAKKMYAEIANQTFAPDAKSRIDEIIQGVHDAIAKAGG